MPKGSGNPGFVDFADERLRATPTANFK